MSNSSRPAAISSLSEISGDFQFILCDVWGVIHNGVSAYGAAVDALLRFRAAGGRVVLITNAPRPSSVVYDQLDRLGVDREAYDDIVSSGDVARSFLAERPDLSIYHLGPDRDLPIYAGLPNALVDEAAAHLVSCTGLFDDHSETPDDYSDQLGRLAERGVPMLCANPDKVVERGDSLVWCAGAIAERYAELGGETIIVGKPYAPIYGSAFARLEKISGQKAAKETILAIGDGAPTDLRGAFDQEIDVLFITDGIHAEEFGAREAPDTSSVHNFLAEAGLGVKNFASRLAW
jgi:HAD superfamily hydrolase (TIGR01459 family)